MRNLLLVVVCLPLLMAAPSEPGARLRVPVWLGGNEPGASLAPGDFTATLDGQPARVLSAHGPSDDLMVLLVLDLTEDVGLVELAKEATIAAIDKLPERAYVGVLRAQDGLRVLLDPTSDHAALSESIRQLPVSGKAGLLETVETASQLADSILDKAAVRLALVYITDSDVRNYRDDYTNPVINQSDSHDMSRRFPEGLVKEKISKLETRMSATQAPLFIVHLDYRNDRLNEAYQSGLLQLTAVTGGGGAFCRSRAEIPAAIQNTFQTIASHYSLELQLPQKPSKFVQVQLENGGHSLTYRNRFVMHEN